MAYWTKVLNRVLYIIFILIGLWLSLKLAIFYMPFLIAFIIYLLMEPSIKWIMKKTKWLEFFLYPNKLMRSHG